MAQAAVLEDTTWREDALDLIERWASEGRQFTADDLRKAMGEDRPAPHQNMVGRLFTMAQGRGLIIKVANHVSRTRSRHGGHQYLWQGVQGRLTHE